MREKKEISEVIELLQDHDKVHQWQSNLREYSSSQTKLNQPPQVAQEHDEIMNMKKTTRNTPVGHRNYINGIHTTDCIKVPQQITFVSKPGQKVEARRLSGHPSFVKHD